MLYKIVNDVKVSDTLTIKKDSIINSTIEIKDPSYKLIGCNSFTRYNGIWYNCEACQHQVFTCFAISKEDFVEKMTEYMELLTGIKYTEDDIESVYV